MPVSQVGAIANCDDALKDGRLGNSLLTQVHQRVEMSQGVLVLAKKDAILSHEFNFRSMI